MTKDNRQITQVVTLRKLTRKSIMPAGTGKGMTVQWCLEHNKGAIDWAYYCLGNITFMDDILDEMNIMVRIDKPGKDEDLYQRRRWAIARSMAENGNRHLLNCLMGTAKSKRHRALKEAREEEAYHTSRARLAWVNQGHK